jgi:hypothetical protein
MAIFGNQQGPTYCLGRINVAVPGTPAPLNQNVTTNTAFATVANPVALRCSEITFKAPGGGTGAAGTNVANTGAVYVCFKGGNRTIANSIIVDLQPGQGFVMSNGTSSNTYDASSYVIDSDNANDGCRVTLTVAA